MREDTKPETPYAKSNSDPPPAPDLWRRPGPADEPHRDDALFSGMPNGTQFDWAFGSGRMHTFRASGPAGIALAVLVLLAIGALISLFFLFAIGFGAVIALGAGAAAVLGLGANMFRRRLPSGRHHELGSGDH